MNGWRYEWVDELPVDVYELLIEWINEQAEQMNRDRDD